MKGKIQKLTAALLTLLISVSLISGCGGSGNQQSAAPAAPAAPAANQAQSQTPAAAPAAAPKGDATVLKLGHINPETGNYHQYALRFKEMVEERSNGELVIEIYPAAQLGYDRELLESMQFGNLDLGIITTSPIANFIPNFSSLDFPFVFDDWNHVYKWLESDAVQELYAEGEDQGLKAFGMVARGFRSTTNSKRPINSAADFGGLKMRVIESPIYIKTFEALGATASAMSWGEVFTALQQGAIEAVELDYRTLYDERVYEVQKYLTKTEHIFAFASLMGSKAIYDNLSPEQQKIIADCALEAGIEVSKLQEPIIMGYIDKLAEAGLEVNEIDRSELKSKMDPVKNWYVQEYTDKYLNAIEACK